MSVNWKYWPIERLRELPAASADETVECDELILLPTEDRHDSGFLFMEVVAVRDNMPVCRRGYADLIDLGGIGGGNSRGLVYKAVNQDPEWRIDCLPGSGLMRIWCDYRLILPPTACSIFEVFYGERRKAK